MGVPALFRWLSQKYPKIISAVIEEQPSEVDGQEIPVNTALPNPNGEEFDNLYLDMNGIVHPCSHPEDRPPPATEGEMMKAIFEYTDRVCNMVRPRKLLLIAVDGVAPRAKMNQQRSRRFRSAQEAKQKDEENAEFAKLLKSQNGGVHELADTMAQKKTWDSNAITPGTPFMGILAASLRYWAAYKVNTDPAWEKVKIIISDATVPGEGEHKIMEFIRSQRSSPEHDPNTRHVLYGLDADLIMLGLAAHEPHFRVLREDVFFQESKARNCKLCGQKGHVAEACRGEVKTKDGEFDEKDKAAPLKPFIWLHVPVLREYLEAELYVPQQPFKFDLERALDDWVFMCFFVGNDFLPHLPSLDIREDGIDTLIAIWRDNIPLMGGYVTKDGEVNLTRAQFILDGLAKQEDAIFKRRRQTEERREANAKRRKLEQDNRNNSRRQNGGFANTPEGRRGSPDYSTPSQMRTGRAKDGVVAPSDLPLFEPGKGLSKEQKTLTHDIVVNRGAVYKANQANKSAAAALKSQLLNGSQAPVDPETSKAQMGDQAAYDGADNDNPGSADTPNTPVSVLGKRKAELIEEDQNSTPGANTPESASKASDPDEPPPDHVRLWEDGYADRYYEQKFKAEPTDIAFRNNVAKAYVEGLAWVLLYYFQGCPSWTWYYPYHYAPFAADFVELDKMSLKFEKGHIFKPFEQLMGVMPSASDHTLPEVFRPLMSDKDSPIIDFYPQEFPIDLNGKKFAWQGVAILPFIDEKRLLDAMATKYPLLSAADVARNEPGNDALIISDRHPLFEEVASRFYSKRQNQPSLKLDPRISGGLAGTVEKNDDYLPQSSLNFSVDQIEMPSLDEDHSMSVNFEIPKTKYVHKSMLLRGLKLPTPVLDNSDIVATKARANHSGRSFGGAPLRGGHSRGRGGKINYADSRPNPFAEHLNPDFGPPGKGFRGPPPFADNTYDRGAPASGSRYGPPPPAPLPRNDYYNAPPAPPPGNGYYPGAPPPPDYRNQRGPLPAPPYGHYGGPPPPPSNGYYPPRPPPTDNYNGSNYNNNSYGQSRDGYHGVRR